MLQLSLLNRRYKKRKNIVYLIASMTFRIILIARQYNTYSRCYKSLSFLSTTDSVINQYPTVTLVSSTTHTDRLRQRLNEHTCWQFVARYCLFSAREWYYLLQWSLCVLAYFAALSFSDSTIQLYVFINVCFVECVYRRWRRCFVYIVLFIYLF